MPSLKGAVIFDHQHNAAYWPQLTENWPSYHAFYDKGGKRTVFIIEPGCQPLPPPAPFAAAVIPRGWSIVRRPRPAPSPASRRSAGDVIWRVT
jgi:hypothetical protein